MVRLCSRGIEVVAYIALRIDDHGDTGGTDEIGCLGETAKIELFENYHFTL
jgi:hypothetical protein